MTRRAQVISLSDDLKADRLPPPEMRGAIRRAAHGTQAKVAEHLGVHPVTVARWEAGTREPRGELRRRYRDALDEMQALAS